MASTDLHAKIRNKQVLIKSGTFDRFPGLQDRVCVSGTFPDDPGRMACMCNRFSRFLKINFTVHNKNGA